MRTLVILIAFVLFTHQISYASSKDPKPKNFKEAFAGYKTALDNYDPHLITHYAQKSYEFGKKQFGAEHANTTALALLWLKAFNAHFDDHKFPKKVIIDAISTLKKGEEKTSDTLVEAYIALGTYTAVTSKSKNSTDVTALYDEAIKIAVNYEKDGTFVALTRIEIGKNMQALFSADSAIPYLIEARDFYLSDSTKHASDLAIANFWLAKAYVVTGEISKAIIIMSAALTTLNEVAPSSQYAIIGHTSMVQILERQGNRDGATLHAQMIGKNQPINVNQEQIPLYQVSAKYPTQALKRKKSGDVLIEFTVDENGFVKNPTAIEGKNMKSFKRSALRAIVNYRFAPAYKNDKPVSTDGLKHRIKFEFKDKKNMRS